MDHDGAAEGEQKPIKPCTSHSVPPPPRPYLGGRARPGRENSRRPIQLVIPFAPGDTDKMLRPFTERMGEFLGNPWC